MSLAICLQDGFIEFKTNTNHSLRFCFNQGQTISYHISDSDDNYNYIISHLNGDAKNFGFPVSRTQFNTYFRDVRHWRESQIDKIIL